MTTTAVHPIADEKPDRAGLVLVALILVEIVANMNLSVANVAIPSIGKAFDASQTSLDLVSVGFSVGLAGSVLYLGAIGDRYGRARMLLIGTALAIPTSIAAAYSPNVNFLIVSRILGGIAAGMAYPTTLALITALWSGRSRTKSIALWSAGGGATAALGPFLAGLALNYFWWGSCFLLTLPLAVVAIILAALVVPKHVNETTESIDHLGGLLSMIGIVALILAINFAPSSGEGRLALVTAVIGVVALVVFFLRQRVAANPLFDLHIASRRIFWVAAIGGIIVFGSLMGAIFIGLQFLQNVLGYSTVEAGASVIPAAIFMMLVAPQSAKLIDRFGSRFTLLLGYSFCLAGFVFMLIFWDQHSNFFEVFCAFVLAGIGVGLAGTPASHSLTGSVPVRRAGMASGTSDLQRDFGGAVMQSLLGALLTAGYASAVAKSINAQSTPISAPITNELQRSYSSAAAIAAQYPSHASAIIDGARSAFLSGANLAYGAGALAVIGGGVIIFFCYPKKSSEVELLASYAAQDSDAS